MGMEEDELRRIHFGLGWQHSGDIPLGIVLFLDSKTARDRDCIEERAHMRDADFGKGEESWGRIHCRCR